MDPQKPQVSSQQSDQNKQQALAAAEQRKQKTTKDEQNRKNSNEMRQEGIDRNNQRPVEQVKRPHSNENTPSGFSERPNNKNSNNQQNISRNLSPKQMPQMHHHQQYHTKEDTMSTEMYDDTRAYASQHEKYGRQQEMNINERTSPPRKGKPNGYSNNQEQQNYDEVLSKRMGQQNNPYCSNYNNNNERQFGFSPIQMERNYNGGGNMNNHSMSRAMDTEQSESQYQQEFQQGRPPFPSKNGFNRGKNEMQNWPNKGVYQEQVHYSQQSYSHSSVVKQGGGQNKLSDSFHASNDFLQRPLNQQSGRNRVDGTDWCTRLIPLIVMGLIGLWTFVFMVAEIHAYPTYSIIQASKITDIAQWHQSDTKMLEAAVAYVSGLENNYISLLDFILQYFVTRLMCTLILSSEYFSVGRAKNFVVGFLLLKDIAGLVLSLTAGSYGNNANGWSEFGFYWTSTIGKLSVLMSLQKIFLVRLNYFQSIPAEKARGCTKLLRSCGVSVFAWAQRRSPHPEAVLILLFLALQLPLLLHIVVGIIEGSLVFIIWMSILLFLQLLIWMIFEMCRPKETSQLFSFTGRLAESLRNTVVECKKQYWAYLLFFFVIAPGVASCSFSANFISAIKFHFTGQQLMLNYFAIPTYDSSYAYYMTFVGNVLSLI